MANPTCSATTLNLACFKGDLLSTKTRLAFRVYYMAKELAAIGGTDYTSVLRTTLISDTISLFDKYSMDDIDAARTAIMYQNAVAAGASVSATPNTVIPFVQALKDQVDEEILTKAETLLMCKLGVHKSYTQ